MLMTLPDDKDMTVEVKNHTCEFHKENPGVGYAGCTCFSSYSQSYVERNDDGSVKCEVQKMKVARKYIDGVWYDYDFEGEEWVARGSNDG